MCCICYHFKMNWYVPQLSYPFICWWTSRLFPCPGYYKQCFDEHWGTRVSFNSGFFSVYAQQWISRSYGSSTSSFLRNLHTEEQFDNKILRVNILFDQSILLLGLNPILLSWFSCCQAGCSLPCVGSSSLIDLWMVEWPRAQLPALFSLFSVHYLVI